MIERKEHWNIDKSHDARPDDDVYHLRSSAESAFLVLKHRFGDPSRARTWFGQFSELVLLTSVRNMEFT